MPIVPKKIDYAALAPRARRRNPLPDGGERPPTPPSEDGEYRVGFGRPPKDTQFKPGQSGNPKGRPKGSRNLSTIVANALDTSVRVRTPDGERRISYREAIVLRVREKAAKGELRAAEKLFAWNEVGEALRLQLKKAPEADGHILTPTDEATLQAFVDLVVAERGIAASLPTTREEQVS